jgi:hypothetical protein
MNRRGMVILAVLIAIVIASVIAMGALSTAASGAEFSRASERSAQLRCLAQSGVAAAAAELAAQRDQLLSGAAPKLTAEWELYKDQDVRGIVTILAHPQPPRRPRGRTRARAQHRCAPRRQHRRRAHARHASRPR